MKQINGDNNIVTMIFHRLYVWLPLSHCLITVENHYWSLSSSTYSVCIHVANQSLVDIFSEKYNKQVSFQTIFAESLSI